jgi:hypothetical protein
VGRIDTSPDGEAAMPMGLWTRGLFVAETVFAVTESAVRSASLADMASGVETLILEPIQ